MNDFGEKSKKRRLPFIDLGRLLHEDVDSPAETQSGIRARDGGEHTNETSLQRNRKDRVIMDWEPRTNHKPPSDEGLAEHCRETSFESHSNKVISMAAMNVVQCTVPQKRTDVTREPYALNPAAVNNVEPIRASGHGTNHHHYHHPGNMTKLATVSSNVTRNVTPASNGRKKRTVKTSAKPTNASARMAQGGPILPPQAAPPHFPVPVVNGMPMYPLQFGNNVAYNGPPGPPLMVGAAPCGPPRGYTPYFPPPPQMQPPCQCGMCCLPQTVSGGKVVGTKRLPHHSLAKSGKNAKKTKGTRKVSSSKLIRNAATHKPKTKVAASKKGDDALAAELLRGVTVRPSGKWVSHAAAHICTCNHKCIPQTHSLSGLCFFVAASTVVLEREIYVHWSISNEEKGCSRLRDCA